jgi:hypothetical protein
METYKDRQCRSALPSHDRQAFGGHESFARDVGGTLPLAALDGRDSVCRGVLCT